MTGETLYYIYSSVQLKEMEQEFDTGHIFPRQWELLEEKVREFWTKLAQAVTPSLADSEQPTAF